MRTPILTASMLALLATPVLAQTPVYQTNDGARPGNVIGSGQSLPLSNNASNINGSDSRSEIAPRLPDPGVGDDAGPRAYLRTARTALVTRQTGMAQEALERAETRALAGSVLASEISEPSRQELVRHIHAARDSLSAGQTAEAMRQIDVALATLSGTAG